MQTLHTTEIKVSAKRQRVNFDDAALDDLTESIRSVGLLSPLVVRQTPEGPTLVAGERRLRAIENLSLLGERVRYAGEVCPEGHAPYNDIGSLDNLAAAEAELEENIRRVDLTWQERTAAEAALVELRRAQAEKNGTPAPSLLEIGKELDPSLGNFRARERARQSIVLQDAIRSDPSIGKAATQADAWKLVQRKEQSRRDTALGLLAGPEVGGGMGLQVFNEDCRTWLARQDPGQFDCILIDPPYGIGADNFGDASGKRTGIEHGYSDDKATVLRLMRDVLPMLYRVAKDEAHLYLWCDIENYLLVREIASEVGFWTHRTPLINIKREGGRVPWPEHGPRRCYELVLYAVKGKRPTTAIYRDVFESTLERNTDGHGAAKPVEAYIDLLRRSCCPGDNVLDCFAGTGTILPAAAALKLRATAVEVDPSYYGQCVRRLEEIKSGDKMPKV